MNVLLTKDISLKTLMESSRSITYLTTIPGNKTLLLFVKRAGSVVGMLILEMDIKDDVKQLLNFQIYGITEICFSIDLQHHSLVECFSRHGQSVSSNSRILQHPSLYSNETHVVSFN